jgi:DNA-binding beta-propeller fold protein YncE
MERRSPVDEKADMLRGESTVIRQKPNPLRVEFTRSTGTQDALARLGRTEDVKFSPSNRRLAISGFAENQILILDLVIEHAGPEASILIADHVEIASTSLRYPHGVSFIDEDTIIVANRKRQAPILTLPPSGTAQKKYELSALRTIRGNWFNRLKSPGSVSVYPKDSGQYEALICNNYVHSVTRHTLDGQRRFRITKNEVLLRAGLRIPDGVSVSRDRRWIAISNHMTHSILVFENTPELDGKTKACAILEGMDYPHGVRFTPDGRFVLVADAGAPYVHVYETNAGRWQSTTKPTRSIRVMDDDTFQKGRYNAEEGGPKGIDIDTDMKVLAVTSEHQVLSFFNLGTVLGLSDDNDSDKRRAPETVMAG